MSCEGCSNAVNRVLGRLDGQCKMMDGLVDCISKNCFLMPKFCYLILRSY